MDTGKHVNHRVFNADDAPLCDVVHLEEHNPRKFKDHERMTLLLEDLLSKTLLWVDGSY